MVADEKVTAIDKTPIYSPAQVFAGSMLGGPVALVYFLRVNFQKLGNAKGMKHTVLWGAVFNLAVLAAIPFLPQKFPKYIFPLAYSLAARSIVESRQLSKEAIANSTQFRFRSNWAVVLWSVLFLIGTLLVWMGTLLLLDSLHVIDLGQ
jgi:hypothetical protein